MGSDLLFVGDLRVDEAFPLDEHLVTAGRIAPGATLIGNLEIPLCGESYGLPAAKLVPFRGSEAIAASLHAGGFAVAGLANNHSTSWGIGGLLRTKAVLAEASIAGIGAGEDLHEALAPWISPDGALAVLALSATVDVDMLAGERRAGVAGVRVDQTLTLNVQRSLEQAAMPSRPVEFRLPDAQVDEVCDEIRRLAAGGVLVVVMLHWGTIFSPETEVWQLDLAERLISAGARLLVGCHSHTVGPIAEFEGVPVVFGLGNWAWSPKLIAASGKRIAGHAARFRRWSRVCLALRVRADAGVIGGFELVPLVFDLTRGIAQDSLRDEERPVVASVLRWLSGGAVADRPGWSVPAIWPEYADRFPFGYDMP